MRRVFRLGKTADGQTTIKGQTVVVTARFEHMKGECAYVTWTLLHEKTRELVDAPGMRDHGGVRYQMGSDTAPSRPGVMWIPLPRHGAPFIVKVEIYDRSGHTLDTKLSKPFS